jgi:phosphoribosylformylglycinamidine cyclo-ligase
MIAAVAPEQAERAVELLTGRGVPAWVAGTVQAGDGGAAARLVGSYR